MDGREESGAGDQASGARRQAPAGAELEPPRLLEQAAALLRAGELVAFPTDTVYGVGAVAWNREAVGKLYVAKLRALEKAIRLGYDNFDHLQQDADLDNVRNDRRFHQLLKGIQEHEGTR